MMNRVAAQNARDRRKNYVEDLEKRVALLEQQVFIQQVCLLLLKEVWLWFISVFLLYPEQAAATGEPIAKGTLGHISC